MSSQGVLKDTHKFAGTLYYDLSSNRLQSRLTEAGQTIDYRYDQNGNLLQGDGRQYQWTAFNQIQTIQTAQQTVHFRYDGSRNRVVKHSDHETKY